ncbi:myosin-IIIa [Trichonephila clavipes]|uniref:Myosin-IIIa n=1 Tax=Trichonephila clavipes TaxID=2585209 RepID=A0A8X6RZW2_TRICX|nr:myosin-IIIa [Trichonephila clavipes]
MFHVTEAKKPNPPPILRTRTEWSETFRDFINECLERNEEHRPNILELLLHPFITVIDDTSNQSLTLEEHLQQEFVPTIGTKVKQWTAVKLSNVGRSPAKEKFEDHCSREPRESATSDTSAMCGTWYNSQWHFALLYKFVSF